MVRLRITAICVLSLAWLCSSLLAEEISVSAKYKPVTGGYRYFFAIENSTAEQPDRYVVYFDILLRNTWDLEQPTGWDSSYITSGSVIWSMARSTPPNWNEGIGPGASLAGFNVSAQDLVDRLHYTVFTYDGAVVPTYSGYVCPQAVPEPAAVMGLGMGLVPLAVALARGRRK